MKTNNLKTKEIKEAINDLKELISGNESFIDRLSLFGSTIQIPIEEAEDIDFFVKYKNCDFETLRTKLLSVKLNRNIVIENHAARYSNHPTWPKENPLRIHIILYNNDSQFSEKLLKTKKYSIDITDAIK